MLLGSVTSIEEAPEIVSAALIAKVRRKCSLAADVPVTPATQLMGLGIDSFVAVDLRTWFSRELAVGIPLLCRLWAALLLRNQRGPLYRNYRLACFRMLMP